MDWSPSGAWLVSADNSGIIKYFQSNMNNLQAFQGHKESVRDITWSPDDSRFATGADDSTIKLWNFERMKEERTLTGHGWDVKCVKWHPTKGLLASGSKDNLVKFWDPRTGGVLTTLSVLSSLLPVSRLPLTPPPADTVTRTPFKRSRGRQMDISSRPHLEINSSRFSIFER